MTNQELTNRAVAKLDLAIAYLGAESRTQKPVLRLDVLDATEATTQALAALVELTNRLNGNQSPKQDR